MPTLRQFLFALLLPVLVLPDGILVCLCRLVGEPPAKSCCAKKHCCTGGERQSPSPVFSAPPRSDCCLAIPENDRSTGPGSTSSKRGDEAAAPVIELAPPPYVAYLVAHAARGPSAWSHHDPPSRSTVPISLPLRL